MAEEDTITPALQDEVELTPAVSEAPTKPLRLGKKFKGEKFVTTKTAEMMVEDHKLQQRYKMPNAVTLSAYFVHKAIRNPVQQAAMVAYTQVRRATISAFDEIFTKF